MKYNVLIKKRFSQELEKDISVGLRSITITAKSKDSCMDKHKDQTENNPNRVTGIITALFYAYK